tara:strand:+ start:6708 stop:7538 length:831 start_codon:yes stop_codon:yes gene_type:complete
MSLLDQEQQDALIAQLTGTATEEPPQELETSEEVEEYEEEHGEEEAYEAEAEHEDEEYEPEQEDGESYDASSEEHGKEEEEEVAEGHRVPYERFRQVNQQRRNLESRLEARDLELKRLQERYESQNRQPQARRDYDNHHEEVESDVAWGAETAPRSDHLEDLQVRVAQMELEKEVSAAISEYPDVPENFIWESIAQNGNQRAHDLAAGYSSFVAEVEEAAIARHLEAMQEEEQQAQNSPAPPRIARRRTVRHQEQEVEQNLTLDQARDAMIAYLKD